MSKICNMYGLMNVNTCDYKNKDCAKKKICVYNFYENKKKISQSNYENIKQKFHHEIIKTGNLSMGIVLLFFFMTYNR